MDNKLATVAELMNHWVREENLIYQEENESLRDDCRDLDMRVYRAEGEMQQMDRLITRLQFENHRLRESNGFLYNRVNTQRHNVALLQSRVEMLESLLQASRAGVNVPAVSHNDSETESEAYEVETLED